MPLDGPMVETLVIGSETRACAGKITVRGVDQATSAPAVAIDPPHCNLYHKANIY